MRTSAQAILALTVATSGAAPAHADAPTGTGPFQQSETGKCKPAEVRSVEQAAIEQGATPKLVARGTAASPGWQHPELRFRSIAKFRSRDATAIYAFVACPPNSLAGPATPIAAETLWNLAPGLGRVYHVLVEAETNSITLDPDKPAKR
jgi:hypothetical protein